MYHSTTEQGLGVLGEVERVWGVGFGLVSVSILYRAQVYGREAILDREAKRSKSFDRTPL